MSLTDHVLTYIAAALIALALLLWDAPNLPKPPPERTGWQPTWIMIPGHQQRQYNQHI